MLNNLWNSVGLILTECRLLFGIFGGLGVGKTLSGAYLSFDHWFQRKEKIFSNIHLFKIPYYYIDSLGKLNNIRDGWFLADELWRMVFSRTPMSRRNKFVYDVLGRARKRKITYCFIAQLLSTLDKTVRGVLDFVSEPKMSSDESYCTLQIFMGREIKQAMHMKDVRFITEAFYKMYDTDEEVDMNPDLEDKEKTNIIFQPHYNKEHGYCCECKECGTKFFDTWEEADKYATTWWEKNWKTVFPNMKLQG